MEAAFFQSIISRLCNPTYLQKHTLLMLHTSIHQLLESNPSVPLGICFLGSYCIHLVQQLGLTVLLCCSLMKSENDVARANVMEHYLVDACAKAVEDEVKCLTQADLGTCSFQHPSTCVFCINWLSP